MKQVLKTTVLMSILIGLFMAVGTYFGGRNGALVALFFGGIMNFGMYWFSDKLVLRMQGAQPLGEHYPEVRRIITQLAEQDGLPTPKLYYVDTPLPNAFATGRNPSHAVVAVTSGIMELLNEKELKAVLAHELGHVKNRDMLVSTIAACVAGAIAYIAQIALFTGSAFSSDDDTKGNIVASLLMMILAPLAATMVQMAVSRSREYLADEHSANTLHSGADLASALQKLEQFKASVPPITARPVDQATAHLMFANMFSTRGIASLFSTHPSTADRVARLKQITPL
ncbi:MAG TPA: zinc metalloprotease HtpX [Candidatus Saccharibacteria bacterium]|jgi:heat shock protein HtpX|nr:zinc metalloprotease HtpX [Candidatus Saccharibacteria bacterium]